MRNEVVWSAAGRETRRVWGPEQHAAFRDAGVVTLRGAFDSTAGAAMQDATWAHVERQTAIRRDDPTTWPRDDTGFATSMKKLKRNAAFGAVLRSRAVTDALDDIFGPRRWQASRNGAQILFSFPTHDPSEWRVNDGPWHMDAPFHRRVDPPHAVKLFSVAAPLPPRSGATMVLAGTSNLTARWARTHTAEVNKGGLASWLPFLRAAHPDLARLCNPDDDGHDRTEACTRPLDIDGQRVEWRELCGDVGDVHIVHINTFHCPPVHAGTMPRLLVTHLISEVEPDDETSPAAAPSGATPSL